MKKRAARFMIGQACPRCHGKRLRPEALSVRFGGLDIAEMSGLPMARFSKIFAPYAEGRSGKLKALRRTHPEKALVVERIAADARRGCRSCSTSASAI